MSVGPIPSLPGLPPALAAHEKFRILKQLGKGGMGTVYLAIETKLDRKVALKICHVANRPDALERFRREAKAAAALRHPNLCPIFDFDVIDGTPYFTMAYIDGPTLADYLERRGPLPPRDAALLVRKIALALHHAHEQGVIHRDLKPSNIALDRGEPIILDFGLARQGGTNDRKLTQLGAILGTPGYMAPEQVEGNPDAMGPATDVYALGVILYELLTGRVPFEGPTTAILACILTREPSRPRSIQPELDEELEAICLRCLAKKRENRFKSMLDLVKALTDWTKRPSPNVRATQAIIPPALPKKRENTPAEPFSQIAESEEQLLVNLPLKRRQRSARKGLLLAAVGAACLLVVSVLALLRTPDKATGPGKKASPTQLTEQSDAKSKKGESSARNNPDASLQTFDLGNGVKLEMVRIPAGKFMMGSPPGEVGRSDNERQHEVTISRPFYLAKYEVTQEQYLAVMGNNPSHFTKVDGEDTRLFPVEKVSWEDAMEFCRKLNERFPAEAMQFDLPTEAQWEYACRAGTTTPYHFGKECNGQQANCDGRHPYETNVQGPFLNRTCRVGSYPPNAWGLYDMHGNVWEWCKDWYGDYPTEPITDPVGPVTGCMRVLRGGSFDNHASHVRSAFRYNLVPTARYFNNGLRPSRTFR